MTADIKTELAKRGLTIIQDAISQNALPVAVHQIKFVCSILAKDIENWEDSTQKELLETTLKKLDDKYIEFLNPKVEINDVVPAEQQLALVEVKRREIAHEIYNLINEIIELLAKNCQGVLG